VSLRDGLRASVVLVIFGLNFVVGKVGVQEVPPLLLMLLRFGLVFVVGWPLALLSPGPNPELRRILVPALFLGGFHFGLLFMSLVRIPAGTAAVVGQLAVPFSSLLAIPFLGEQMTAVGWLGITLSLSGVAVMAGELRVDQGMGSLFLVVLAALAWAFANIFLKRLGPVNPWRMNAAVATCALPLLALGTWTLESDQWESLRSASWRAWGSVAYMALGASLTAYSLWYGLLQRNDVGRLVPLTLLVPVLAVMFGVLLLGETLTLTRTLGALLVLLGTALVTLRGPSPVPPSSEAGAGSGR
jgi:O-acetylserine/cysteine efflux transporter